MVVCTVVPANTSGADSAGGANPDLDLTLSWRVAVVGTDTPLQLCE